jgi:putative transposase
MPKTRKTYPSDLTDEQWGVIEPLIPPMKDKGRPRTVNMREIINAVSYINRTGCAWRSMPHDLPPWGTVWAYYWRFRQNGVWQKIHDTLREKVRLKEGRQGTPSAAIVDSQSVKTTE